ncbi:MAG: TetR/AcrR family transcriptional regulator [Sphingomicrobium sp.]
MTGRVAKMEETRRRIIDSAAELYMQMSIDEFTLEEVARRAETTVQTILRVHGSRDQLLFAAIERLTEEGVPLKPTAPGNVADAVSAIFDLYETSGQMILRWLSDEQRRPQLSATLEKGRSDHRDWIRLVFAPHLEAASGESRKLLFNALVLATDIYSWNKLRKDNGLSRKEAERVVCSIIEAVLERENNHGKTAVAQLVRRRKPSA